MAAIPSSWLGPKTVRSASEPILYTIYGQSSTEGKAEGRIVHKYTPKKVQLGERVLGYWTAFLTSKGINRRNMSQKSMHHLADESTPVYRFAGSDVLCEGPLAKTSTGHDKIKNKTLQDVRFSKILRTDTPYFSSLMGALASCNLRILWPWQIVKMG